MKFQAASGPRRAKGEHDCQDKSPPLCGIWFSATPAELMSDLHRSAISARLAKLPPFLPTAQDDDNDDEMIDTIGNLPVSGIGPPAMQVMIFIGVVPMFIQNWKA